MLDNKYIEVVNNSKVGFFRDSRRPCGLLSAYLSKEKAIELTKYLTSALVDTNQYDISFAKSKNINGMYRVFVGGKHISAELDKFPILTYDASQNLSVEIAILELIRITNKRHGGNFQTEKEINPQDEISEDDTQELKRTKTK